VNSSREHERRATIRMDARLDATTRATVDDLAKRFHRSRAAVVCHVMRWGLSREHTETLDQGNAHGPVRHLYLYVPSVLHEHVEKAAAAAGVKAAAWVRHMVRQVTIEDFPACWQDVTPRERSDDSRTYTKRFMRRLDHPSQAKLEHLSRSVAPQKPTSSATSSPRQSARIFPRAGTGRRQSTMEHVSGKLPHF
jgi:hypothetical protein